MDRPIHFLGLMQRGAGGSDGVSRERRDVATPAFPLTRPRQVLQWILQRCLRAIAQRVSMRFVSTVVFFALLAATVAVFLRLEGMSWWTIFHVL